MMCCFCCMGQFMGENPTERLAFGGCLQTLALCTVCNFANTLRRFAVYPRFALCRARPVVPRHKLLTKQTHFICLFVFCLFIPFPREYTVSRGVPVNFAFEVTLSLAIMLALLLACSFAPRVHSIPRGPHILKKAHQDDVLFLLYGTIYGREPNRTVSVRRLKCIF